MLVCSSPHRFFDNFCVSPSIVVKLTTTLTSSLIVVIFEPWFVPLRLILIVVEGVSPRRPIVIVCVVLGSRASVGAAETTSSLLPIILWIRDTTTALRIVELAVAISLNLIGTMGLLLLLQRSLIWLQVGRGSWLVAW